MKAVKKKVEIYIAKHFIATLGVGCYNSCEYELNGNSVCTKFVQEALLQMNDFKEGDKITIFLTDLVKKMNWNNREYKEKDVMNLKRFALENESIPNIGDKK